MTPIAATAGFIFGAALCWGGYRYRCGSFEGIAAKIVQKAEEEAKQIQRLAEIEAGKLHADQQRQFEQTWQIERKKMEREQDRFQSREERLEAKLQSVEKKLVEIAKKEAKLQTALDYTEKEREELVARQQEAVCRLEAAAGISRQEAKEQLIQSLTEEVKRESAEHICRIRAETEEESDRLAAKIIGTAIGRLAVSSASEGTVNTLAIPNEEMKGRIIGREGRNIKAFERTFGVNLFVDDTPGMVVISTFDPVRLHVAKTALADLLADGRIHPTRIEEAHVKALEETKKKIRYYGQDAALRAGIVGLHDEILKLLGKLKFRFSYGQNILEHSLEVSHLMGMMADELGLDGLLARRIGLLHDMGKALTHEIQGTHAVIGHDFALKYGESKEVANGIGCHHREMEPITVEGSLCSAADSISASRPGARMEPVEEYVKRLKKLEELAYTFPGVEKAYALQAGRELRVIVLPDEIDDAGTVTLARDLSKIIESKMHVNGKIKVSVIRETQAVEWAL